MKTVRNNKMHHTENNAEDIILPLKGRKNGSPRRLENVAPPRFPRGSANPKPPFAFLPRQISSSLSRPWQVLQRRNVLTRNDAQQSFKEEEKESLETASRSERVHPLLTSAFVE